MTANVRDVDPMRGGRSTMTADLAMIVASAVDEYCFKDLAWKAKDEGIPVGIWGLSNGLSSTRRESVECRYI